MRSVTISSVILGLILTFTIANTVLLNNFCEDLLSNIEYYDAKSLDRSTLDDIYNKFDKKSVYINLTVNHEMLGGVKEALYELIAATDAADEESAQIAKSRLTYEVKRLWEMERFSILSIL